MSLHYANPGWNDVASYLLPGVPWVTSSNVNSGTVHEHAFWRVARTVTVINSHASYNLHVGFTRLGLTSTSSNYFEIPPATAIPLDMRIKTIFVRGSGSGPTPYSIVVSQGGVMPYSMPEITGSYKNPDGSTSGSFGGVG